MAKGKHKRTPKTVLKLPDLEQSKSAVMNSLTSASSKRSYDHAIREFIDWYCSEPRLAFNRTVVTRYRIALEQHSYAPSTINLVRTGPGHGVRLRHTCARHRKTLRAEGKGRLSVLSRGLTARYFRLRAALLTP